MDLLKTVVLLLLAAVAATHAVSAQITSEQLKRSLVSGAGFTAEDIAALESGEMVVRALPSKEKREVGVLGVVKINDLPDVSRTVFRDSLAQDKSGPVTREGQFSSPPAIADLDQMELDGEDMEDLPKCKRGECLLNLSGEMLAKFEREVDWAAPDARDRATRLMRQMIVDYVRTYSAGGNRTLGEFADRKVPIDLAAEHEKLLTNSVVVSGFAPELVEYLRKFPDQAPAGVENTFLWSAVDFGLDPIIAVTHIATHMRSDGGMQQHFMATKQIYATRYVDASLAFTALLRVAEDGGTKTYLIFTNRSTSEDMGGMFGDVKRAVVESEAVSQATELIDKAHIRLKSATMQKAEPLPKRGMIARLGKFAKKPWVILLGIVLTGLFVFLAFRRSTNR